MKNKNDPVRLETLPLSEETSPPDKRQSWGNKTEYILASIGNAVGLGNIWRFSYMCQKNGGGAFLIPYVLMLFFVGYPLLFLELVMGQRLRKGAVGVWCKVSPYATGIGISSLVVACYIGMYYNVIVSWALLYAVQSFRSPLPWTSCPPANQTGALECIKSSSTVYFWYRETLDISTSIQNGYEIKWWLAISLLGAWVIIFFGLVKGPKSTGKFMYFNVIFPYVVLTAFLVRALLLKGSFKGVAYLFKIDMSKLLIATTWGDAATQIFFSLGMGYGVYIAYASYSKPHGNCMMDCYIVASVNSLTSIFSAVIVFAVLGFKADVNVKNCLLRNEVLINSTTEATKNITLELCSIEKELNQTVGGSGLAFIAFTEAIANFPFPQLWSVIFFVMLVGIGGGSLLGTMTGIIANITDLGAKISNFKLAAILCSGMYIVGLMFTMESGSYFLDLFDSNVANITLIIIVICENLAVIFVYSIDRFKKDVYFISGKEMSWYWKITLIFVCPAVLGIVVVLSIYTYAKEPLSYMTWNPITATKDLTVYPAWAQVMIVLLIISGVVYVPLVALLQRYKIYDWNKLL